MASMMMRNDKTNIKHRFDPWHLAKSVLKDLVAASKIKECSDLVPWMHLLLITFGGAQQHIGRG